MRRWHHSDFTVADLIARERTVTVVVPARNEAAGIGLTVERLIHLQELGAIDSVLVANHSEDETARIASSLGAKVIEQSEIRSSLGPVLGKGDAVWRALHQVVTDIVCFVDADSADFDTHYIVGLVGPLLAGEGRPQFVKGTFRRPFTVDGVSLPDGGGRVTELTAKPLLRAFFPEITLSQPLAGEIAADRTLLERLPFVTGYGVDIGLVLDVFEEVGVLGMCEVDLDTRQNAHQSLRDLAPMADAVLHTVLSRLQPDMATGALVERSPIAGVIA